LLPTSPFPNLRKYEGYLIGENVKGVVKVKE
jgi:hypothetical protein